MIKASYIQDSSSFLGIWRISGFAKFGFKHFISECLLSPIGAVTDESWGNIVVMVNAVVWLLLYLSWFVRFLSRLICWSLFCNNTAIRCAKNERIKKNVNCVYLFFYPQIMVYDIKYNKIKFLAHYRGRFRIMIATAQIAHDFFASVGWTRRGVWKVFEAINVEIDWWIQCS